MPRKKTTIPKFKGEAEEAAWWDSHPEVATGLLKKAVKEGSVRRGLPTSRSITIRLPVKDVEAAQQQAERKGLPYQTYIKMLLHQALERERLAG